MHRHLEEKNIDNCLALMELVKNDFAEYSKVRSRLYGLCMIRLQQKRLILSTL